MGDSSDIKRVCKQVMNKTVSKRIISKQEACVLLGELDLVQCTESIYSISISNSKTIRVNDSTDTSLRNGPRYHSFVDEYKHRPINCEHLSLDKYFHYKNNSDPAKKTIIPNFVGVNGAPKYPVTHDYARHTLIVHKPWRTYPSPQTNWIQEFETFIHSPECPLGARMGYERVMRRYIDRMTHYEPKASTVDHSANPITPDDNDLMVMLGLKHEDDYDEETAMFKNMQRGYEYEWDRPPKVNIRCYLIPKIRHALIFANVFLF